MTLNKGIQRQNFMYYMSVAIDDRQRRLLKSTDNHIECITFPHRQVLQFSVQGKKNKIQLNCARCGDKIGNDVRLSDDNNHPVSWSVSISKGDTDILIVGIVCDEWSKPLYQFRASGSGHTGAWTIEGEKFIY